MYESHLANNKFLITVHHCWNRLIDLILLVCLIHLIHMLTKKMTTTLSYQLMDQLQLVLHSFSGLSLSQVLPPAIKASFHYCFCDMAVSIGIGVLLLVSCCCCDTFVVGLLCESSNWTMNCFWFLFWHQFIEWFCR